MNRVAMILGAGIVGMVVATAAGASGRSSSMHPSTGPQSSGQQFMKQATVRQSSGQPFMKQNALRGEITRVQGQKFVTTKSNTNPGKVKFDPSKGTFDPNKGKFDPSKVKFDPSKGTFDLNKGKFDPNKGKFDPSKGTFDPKKGKIDPSKSKIDSSKIKVDPNKGKVDQSKGKIDPNKGRFDRNPLRKFDQLLGSGILGKNGQFLANHHVSGGAFKKLPDKHHKSINGLVQSKNVSAAQKGSLNKINSGQQLSTQDRQNLTTLLNNPPADLTRESREAINAALTIDSQASKVERYTRFLRLYNGTDEPLKVWVQYHTYTDKNTWSWFPSAPAAESAKAVSYSLKAGQSTKLADGQDGWIIHASRVRVWGKSANGAMIDEFRGNDLVLVPETNQAGEPSYFAAEQETYTYTFAPEANEEETKQ